MKIIELDLTGCKNLSDIHDRIRKAFNFPKWYGRNWNAFWDLLWSECDADKLIIKGEAGLPDELIPQVKIMHEVLDEEIKFTEENHLNVFSYEIID